MWVKVTDCVCVKVKQPCRLIGLYAGATEQLSGHVMYSSDTEHLRRHAMYSDTETLRACHVGLCPSDTEQFERACHVGRLVYLDG